MPHQPHISCQDPERAGFHVGSVSWPGRRQPPPHPLQQHWRRVRLLRHTGSHMAPPLSRWDAWWESFVVGVNCGMRLTHACHSCQFLEVAWEVNRNLFFPVHVKATYKKWIDPLEVRRDGEHKRVTVRLLSFTFSHFCSKFIEFTTSPSFVCALFPLVTWSAS